MIDEELRQKGERLLINGCALGDTSGRTKILEEKNVFALSSKDFEFSILAPSSEKKKIFNKLNREHGEIRSQTIMHAVMMRNALNGYINTHPSFYICCDGFEIRLLKSYIKDFLGAKWHEQKINILPSLMPMFKKHNIADILARDVSKNGKRPTMVLKEKHFKNLGLL